MDILINPLQIADTEISSEFDEWLQNGLEKAEEMIKDTARR